MAGYLCTPSQALSCCSFCTSAGDLGSDSSFQSHAILAEEGELACNYVYLSDSLSTVRAPRVETVKELHLLLPNTIVFHVPEVLSS